LNPRRTQVHRQTGAVQAITNFRSALSLHSHTYHSKENLEFLPRYLNYHNIPLVTRLAQGKLKDYEARNGRPIDFSRAYWTPPVSSALVLASETEQIENQLGLRSFVSITDHDTIAGPLQLHRDSLQGADAERVPISVEWTIPFGGNSFHMGVHCLPPSRAEEIMQELAAYTAAPCPDRLCDLMALLGRTPETLLVLNHPCCNFVKVPADQHWSSLQRFLGLCRPWIHAIEINGMRPWAENQKVPALAEEHDLPIVAGGDRHGCRPNTMLNLTQAETWGEYVAEIRDGLRNHVLVLPAYEEPVRLRELATAGDVLRRYPHHPYGQRRFTDRIWADVDGYSWNRLSFYLDGGYGTPVWLPPLVATIVRLGSDRVRPWLRTLFSMRGEYERGAGDLKPEFASLATSLMMESPQQ
jgi:hypothetical protein